MREYPRRPVTPVAGRWGDQNAIEQGRAADNANRWDAAKPDRMRRKINSDYLTESEAMNLRG